MTKEFYGLCNLHLSIDTKCFIQRQYETTTPVSKTKRTPTSVLRRYQLPFCLLGCTWMILFEFWRSQFDLYDPPLCQCTDALIVIECQSAWSAWMSDGVCTCAIRLCYILQSYLVTISRAYLLYLTQHKFRLLLHTYFCQSKVDFEFRVILRIRIYF